MLLEQKNNKIVNAIGEDVSKQFNDGAIVSLNKLKDAGINIVILKERSPSCGYKKVYDGTFSKTLVDGNGVFAKLAIENGFIIYTETDIKEIIKKGES